MNPVILYDNRLSDGTPTATDTAAGYDVLHLRDGRTYTKWRAGGAGPKTITVDAKDEGLAVLWDFDEGSGTAVSDSSGQGKDGTLVSAGWRPGVSGAAAEFAGAGYLRCAALDGYGFPQKDVSIAFWLYIDTLPVSGHHNVLHHFNSLSDGHFFARYSSEGVFQFTGHNHDGYQFYTGTTVPAGEWVHICYTYSFSGSAVLYVNGSPVQETTAGAAGFSPVGQLMMVNSLYLGDYALDDFRIYSRALSAADVANLCANGSTLTADALGIVGHNLGTASCRISVESSPNGTIWTERLAPFAPLSDLAILETFTKAAGRFWRISIDSPALIPEMAVCLLGERLDFPFPPEVPFTPYTEDVEEESSRSKAGHLLGTVVRYKSIAIAPQFRVLDRGWVYGAFKAFWDNHASERKPFFWAWDLDAMPGLIFFVKHAGQFAAPVSKLAYADGISLKLEGVKE